MLGWRNWIHVFHNDLVSNCGTANAEDRDLVRQKGQSLLEPQRGSADARTKEDNRLKPRVATTLVWNTLDLVSKCALGRRCLQMREKRLITLFMAMRRQVLLNTGFGKDMLLSYLVHRRNQAIPHC